MRKFFVFLLFLMICVGGAGVVCAQTADGSSPLDNLTEEQKGMLQQLNPVQEELNYLDKFRIDSKRKITAETDLKKKSELMKDYAKEYEKMINDVLVYQVRAGKITDERYEELKKKLKDTVKAYNKKIEAVDDEVKEKEKEAEKARKEAEKQAEKERKAQEKAQKKQDKLVDDANEKIEKMEDALAECEAMIATPETRAACAEKARKKYELDEDELQALNNKAAQDAVKKLQESSQPEEKKAYQEVKGEGADPTASTAKTENEQPENVDENGGFRKDARDKDGGMFSQLLKAGSEIFEGMKMIIYAVAGFGIVAIAIGGFFGNFNFKWLSAIIIGLIVISMMAGILSYMTESDLDSSITIQDSLIKAM